MRFAKSARKHRIGRAHALQVLQEHDPVIVLPDGLESPRMLWIGQDSRGLELEIVALDLPEYLLVIHVMPLAFRRRQ